MFCPLAAANAFPLSSSPSTSSLPISSSLSSLIHRPTPLHPLQWTDEEAPLDLSSHATPHRHETVIQTASSLRPPSPLLPTCSKPNESLLALRLASNAPNRMSYPREFKLLVMDYFHANGQNKYRTCKEFQITKSMLNGWLQKIEKIRASRPGSLKSGRSGRRPQFPDIEKELFQLYASQLEAGHKVGNRWIRDTARELALRSGVSQLQGGMCQFSERWLSNFKKRHHINLNRDSASSTSSGEQRDSDDGDSDSRPSSPAMAAAREILARRDRLPIDAFYEKNPWLCRRGPQTAPGRRGRKVQFPQVETALAQRLQRRLEAGEKPSNRWLQEEARQLAETLCPELLEAARRQSRSLFSEHWLHNFKKRHGLSLRGDETRPLLVDPSTDSSSSSLSPADASFVAPSPWLPYTPPPWTVQSV